MVYLMETNANVYSWLVEFYKKNPIPKVGMFGFWDGWLLQPLLLHMAFSLQAAWASAGCFSPPNPFRPLHQQMYSCVGRCSWNAAQHCS